MAREQTFSNYKHYNSVKYLIAIILYQRDGVAEYISDKHLTEHCSLLSYFLPGDVVLADHGFTVQDYVEIYCSEVRMPPFPPG